MSTSSVASLPGRGASTTSVHASARRQRAVLGRFLSQILTRLWKQEFTLYGYCTCTTAARSSSSSHVALPLLVRVVESRHRAGALATTRAETARDVNRRERSGRHSTSTARRDRGERRGTQKRCLAPYIRVVSTRVYAPLSSVVSSATSRRPFLCSRTSDGRQPRLRACRDHSFPALAPHRSPTTSRTMFVQACLSNAASPSAPTRARLAAAQTAAETPSTPPDGPA